MRKLGNTTLNETNVKSFSAYHHYYYYYESYIKEQRSYRVNKISLT